MLKRTGAVYFVDNKGEGLGVNMRLSVDEGIGTRGTGVRLVVPLNLSPGGRPLGTSLCSMRRSAPENMLVE